MDTYGVVHGRFQILHSDHLKYLIAAKKRCRYLIIGITNPDPTLTRPDPAGGRRSDPAENPLTYYERSLLIRAALIELGWRLEDFSLVPFPVNFPELYHYYLPLDATFFLTIYDQWGEAKLTMFQSLGLKVEILWRKPLSEKGITGKHIREHIIRNEPWDHLVPPAVARTLRSHNLLEKIREKKDPR